jgi:cobalt-zinc-cadmium efflux system membrane fusion protein
MYRIGIAMIIIVAMVTGCGPGSSPHGESEAHEKETIQRTLFSGNTEFFIEHAILETGKESKFLVHVTWLDTYSPCLTGTLTVQMGGTVAEAGKPDRPGIFILTLIPEQEGASEIICTLRSGDITAMVRYPAEVHPEGGGAHARAEEENGGTEPGDVTFSKEQAWNNDFMVQQIAPGSFSFVLKTSGEILTVPGEKKNVAATGNGMVVFPDKTLVQGSVVEKGQLLFIITASTVGSDNFELRYQEYLNSLEKSRSEFERHRHLFEKNVIPERQYLESRANYISDSIRFYDLAGKTGKNGLKVLAPAAGYIHYLNVSEGQYVATGQLLVTISSDRSLLLRADVPQQHYGQLQRIVTANFRPAFTRRVYSVKELDGKLLARGSSVAENDHYIPLYFKVTNDGTLLEGAFAEFYLLADSREGCILVPETAILEEQGNHYVYLQVTGVSYSKRAVVTGDSDGIQVEVISGLHEGDRVVSRGAMFLKAASIVTFEPAHEHSH